MKFVKLTALESGTPVYIKPEDVFAIKTGTKLREEVIIGEDNKVTFAVIVPIMGQPISVRETPDQAVVLFN